MNCVFIMIDSLNRDVLTPYGAKDMITPNFERLAKRCVTFENHWIASTPTIPCRHEVHAGRHDYLWRPWGPLEPYDVTPARLCRDAGRVSMFLTDTYHYWMAGGGNYHMDFSGFEFLRGHENDTWVTDDIDFPRHYGKMLEERGEKAKRYARNTARFRDERDFFAPRLFNRAAEWLDWNHRREGFFFMIDSFDVHEPFHVPPPYDNLYDPDFIGEWNIWNNYGKTESFDPRVLKHIVAQYRGKVTMLDKWMGLVLDRMDRYGLWDNTALIVTSDHGHMLGSQGWVGKNNIPFRRELAHVPLFISWPGMKFRPGSRTKALTSQIDLYPTVLDALETAPPDGYVFHGYSMEPLLMKKKRKIRDVAQMGYYALGASVTDGRHILHKMPVGEENQPLYNYGINLDAFHIRSADPYRHRDLETGRFLPYTDAVVYRVPMDKPYNRTIERDGREILCPDTLFDFRLGDDLNQDLHGSEPAVVARLEKKLREELRRVGAPCEQFTRLGL